MCGLRDHANLRNKTVSRGFWGHESNAFGNPGAETSAQVLYWLECATRKARENNVPHRIVRRTHIK